MKTKYKKGEKGMFDNAGGKIKAIAKVIAWIGIAVCGIYGFVMLVSVEDMALIGLLIMTVGPLAVWISSLVLYGFGELIENSSIIANKKNTDAPKTSAKDATLEKWRKDGLITEEEYQAKKCGTK